jgi:hypothetical protein
MRICVIRGKEKFLDYLCYNNEDMTFITGVFLKGYRVTFIRASLF